MKRFGYGFTIINNILLIIKTHIKVFLLIMPKTKHTYWFIFQKDTLVLLAKPDPHRLSLEDFIPVLKPYFIRQLKLEIVEQEAYCAEISGEAELPEDLVLVPLRKAFEELDNDWYATLVKAYSVINWDKNHQFCGHCSNPTQPRLGVFERVCSVCGLSVYPRISPSVIVLIKKEDHVLMARSPHFPPGVFGLIAGFVEVGESLEETVHREVMEEVGITIKNLRYFDSQPWPFPDSLMVGFIADYASGELKIDRYEIEEAGWYRYDELPIRRPSSVTIARRLIEHFLAEMAQKH